MPATETTKPKSNQVHLILQGKGGVGKSLVAAHAGSFLATQPPEFERNLRQTFRAPALRRPASFDRYKPHISARCPHRDSQSPASAPCYCSLAAFGPGGSARCGGPSKKRRSR
jgi:hypothetical protein